MRKKVTFGTKFLLSSLLLLTGFTMTNLVSADETEVTSQSIESSVTLNQVTEVSESSSTEEATSLSDYQPTTTTTELATSSVETFEVSQASSLPTSSETTSPVTDSQAEVAVSSEETTSSQAEASLEIAERQTDASANQAVYRLYNKTLKEHLFTADLNEYNVLAGRGWSQENVSWYAPTSGTQVTRLYSKVTHKHLYTTDANEVRTLLSYGTWTQDAMTFYSGGSVSIYRLYHTGIRSHLLTADVGEYNTLRSAWNGEGVKLNAVALPSAISNANKTASGAVPTGGSNSISTLSGYNYVIEADVSLTGSGTGYHAKLVVAAPNSAISFGLQYSKTSAAPYTSRLGLIVENISSNNVGQQSYTWGYGSNPIYPELGQTYKLMLAVKENGEYAAFINGVQIQTGKNAAIASQAKYLRVEGAAQKNGDTVNASFSNIKLQSGSSYQASRTWTGTAQFNIDNGLSSSLNGKSMGTGTGSLTSTSTIVNSGTLKGLNAGSDWDTIADGSFGKVSSLVQFY